MRGLHHSLALSRDKELSKDQQAAVKRSGDPRARAVPSQALLLSAREEVCIGVHANGLCAAMQKRSRGDPMAEQVPFPERRPQQSLPSH